MRLRADVAERWFTCGSWSFRFLKKPLRPETAFSLPQSQKSARLETKLNKRRKIMSALLFVIVCGLYIATLIRIWHKLPTQTWIRTLLALVIGLVFALLLVLTIVLIQFIC